MPYGESYNFFRFLISRQTPANSTRKCKEILVNHFLQAPF